MGMQIPHRLHPEISTKSLVWRVEKTHGRVVPRIGSAERKQDRGRASDARSRAYFDFDPAEVFRGGGDGLHEGQECDPHRQDVCWEEEELCGAALLGEGIYGINGWQR